MKGKNPLVPLTGPRLSGMPYTPVPQCNGKMEACCGNQRIGSRIDLVQYR